jgi:hypothetical protein
MNADSAMVERIITVLRLKKPKLLLTQHQHYATLRKSIFRQTDTTHPKHDRGRIDARDTVITAESVGRR